MIPSELPILCDRMPRFQSLLEAAKAAGSRTRIDGLTGPSKALCLARIHQVLGFSTLVVTHHTEQTVRLLDDLRNFGVPAHELFHLPSTRGLGLPQGSPDYRATGERIAALAVLASGARCIVVATADAAVQRTMAPKTLLGSVLRISTGSRINLIDVLRRLVALGYDSDTTVSRPGQFSRRGGIVDIFPSAAELPVRIDLFGDEVESIRSFDISTQRSTTAIAGVTIHPAREVVFSEIGSEAAIEAITAALVQRKIELAAEKNREAFDTLKDRVDADIEAIRSEVFCDRLDEYGPWLWSESNCAVDFLTEDGALVLDEPDQISRQWERLQAEIADTRTRRFARGEVLEADAGAYLKANALAPGQSQTRCLVLSGTGKDLPGFTPDVKLSVTTAVMETYRSRLPFFADEVRRWIEQDADCVLFSDQPHRAREICVELGAPLAPEHEDSSGLKVLDGRLRVGFKFPDIRLYVATDAELFGSSRPPSASRRANTGIPISTLLDLRENDYVVHVHHGIGVYRGLVKRNVDGAQRDFLYVQYAGADRLYVPADQIDRLQRFIGGDGNPPVVNRIGGNEWQKTTRKVKEQARIMARELIGLYAARQAAHRPSYGGDSPWQIEMEEAFPYDETPSQLRAIKEVKADLRSDRPMDRLICGDVGFGKTEVAIRAAFKVVESGKQVAVLCPTTILAAQHYQTFSDRLAAYPTEVDLLSRFRNKQEQKKTLEAMRIGSADVVIGTHRLLSKDVEFKNLGLLIVDEEQRFGVAHKERLKQMRNSVDVLTLSATPIPRTLSMALSGLREMSTIEDPPTGRVPIATFVREYSDDLVRDAILRELERDGQVYVVHNRVETIDQVARRIQRLVPDARIRVGHGQMDANDLEQIMLDFYHREYDILVCTTIIENGLDVPNVNTIVVDHADKLGLAQLYQLRGRVGRASRQAYAFLLYRPSRILSEEAERRLFAIKEYTALGSGSQIAMRDLEIRGAGNLLGAEQSGAMFAVGFDMYCQLLAQAVSELRGDPIEDDVLPPADIAVTAHIPDEYVPSEVERIFFYKRMSAIRTYADVDALQEELEDRYGDPPAPVWNALAVLRLRLRAKHAGIAAIRGEKGQVSLRFAPHVRLTAQSVKLLTHMFRSHRFTPDSVVIGLKSPNVLEEVEGMVNVIERALGEGGNIVKDAMARRA